MASELPMSPHLEQIHGEIRDHFRALAYAFLLTISSISSYIYECTLSKQTVEFTSLLSINEFHR